MCKLASTIVKAAWTIANNSNLEGFVQQNANCQLVRLLTLLGMLLMTSNQIADVLNCLTRNQSCALASAIVGDVPNPGQPFSRYVSTVPSDAFSTDAATGESD